ncbi:metallophosphoesterase [Oceanobacillus oncorhynchi]|uniref:metallophosphoesterase n=1 Tax=Oceanobacillus oncorhynchi TaxID=545501 RepID=UPI0034D71A27
MTNWYTSDSHFYHKSVIDFCNRPFSDVDEMNAAMIESWNQVVGKSDIVYHLGDFCFGGIEKWTEILDQLNGEIILIKGNHDDSKTLKKLTNKGYFKEIHEVGLYRKQKYKGVKYQMWLSHYPMQIGMRERKFSIHGHLHDEKSRDLNQINVGVDSFRLPNRPFGQPIEEDVLMKYLMASNPFIKMVKEEERRGVR